MTPPRVAVEVVIKHSPYLFNQCIVFTDKMVTFDGFHFYFAASTENGHLPSAIWPFFGAD